VDGVGRLRRHGLGLGLGTIDLGVSDLLVGREYERNIYGTGMHYPRLSRNRSQIEEKEFFHTESRRRLAAFVGRVHHERELR
jgi:hypothetical protein